VLTFSLPLHRRLLATGRYLTALPLSMLHYGATSLRRLAVRFPVRPRPVGIITLKNRTLSPLHRLRPRTCQAAREGVTTRHGPLRVDAVEKVGGMPAVRNKRIVGDDFLNRSCALGLRLESILLGDRLKILFQRYRSESEELTLSISSPLQPG
jgi:hypothetical protein